MAGGARRANHLTVYIIYYTTSDNRSLVSGLPGANHLTVHIIYTNSNNHLLVSGAPGANHLTVHMHTTSHNRMHTASNSYLLAVEPDVPSGREQIVRRSH